MSGRVVWVQLNRAFKLPVRLREIEIEAPNRNRQRGVRFCQGVVQCKSLLRRRLSFWVTFARKTGGVTREQGVTVGKSGVGKCVIGIDRSSLLKVIDRLLQIATGTFVSKRSGLSDKADGLLHCPSVARRLHVARNRSASPAKYRQSFSRSQSRRRRYRSNCDRRCPPRDARRLVH